jgi:hypothetical protein
VQRRVGEVAFELKLPPERNIHNVFHVSCLKRHFGHHVVANEEIPPVDEDGHLILIPGIGCKEETIIEYGYQGVFGQMEEFSYRRCNLGE